MTKNDVNIFYTGCNSEHLKFYPDLKLTIDMYMKIQMEYLFSRTKHIHMTTVPGDINPAKVELTVLLDPQIVTFINDWSNNLIYDKMTDASIDFLSLSFIENEEHEQINAIGFSHMRPLFEEYSEYKRGKNRWFDGLMEGQEYVFTLEGRLYANSPHYDIILKNFVNIVTPPVESDTIDAAASIVEENNSSVIEHE